MMSIIDLVVFHMKTQRKDSGFFFKKEIIELIHLDP